MGKLFKNKTSDMSDFTPGSKLNIDSDPPTTAPRRKASSRKNLKIGPTTKPYEETMKEVNNMKICSFGDDDGSIESMEDIEFQDDPVTSSYHSKCAEEEPQKTNPRRYLIVAGA